MVMLVEPWQVNNHKVYQRMPILKTMRPIYPLKLECYNFTLHVEALHSPKEGETTFFVYHNAKIKFGHLGLVGVGDIYPPSCEGLL